MLIHKREGTRGFTIVELLIVVVIIAILAAITLVTYNGVQQRATNTAIIDAASKSLRMIQAYIAANGTYPKSLPNGSACVTTVSGCYTTSAISANTTFDTNMATIGSLPRSLPSTGADYYGIYVTYTNNFTYNTSTQPLTMVYFLQGVSQSCGLSGVTTYAWPDTVTSTTGYTNSNINSTGKTLCWISIPGPTS